MQINFVLQMTASEGAFCRLDRNNVASGEMQLMTGGSTVERIIKLNGSALQLSQKERGNADETDENENHKIILSGQCLWRIKSPTTKP